MANRNNNQHAIVQAIEQFFHQYITNLDRSYIIYIGYSGGVDSHVLLHATYKLSVLWPNITIKAIHINHQLHPKSSSWQQHCQSICKNLGVDYLTTTLTIETIPGQSLEAIARKARYQALSQFITTNDYLLTAHHQDDQAETILLQLLRGAGPKGLASMALMKPFGQSFLARPLLGLSKATILDYAKDQQLSWVYDTSNQCLDYRRNFLRSQILPRLKQQWPSASKTLARSAHHCAIASELNHQLGELDLAKVCHDSDILSQQGLKQLSDSRQRNVIRYWLQKQNIMLPSTIKLNHIIKDVIYSSARAKPVVTWGNTLIKRLADQIFIEKMAE